MLDYIHCGIGIEARVAVCQEDLQPLIDQLSIAVGERRAVLPSRPVMPCLTGRRLIQHQCLTNCSPSGA
jgi:hypothetical protein